MANCSPEDSLELLMNLWKAFQVMLEYSCKTEYRLLITRMQEKHDRD